MDDQGKGDMMEDAALTLHLQVPNAVVGSVIGKQGEVVKAIREQTRCRVIIADPVHGAEDRDVTLKGPHASVDQAIQSIISSISQMRVQSFSPDQSDADLSLKLLVANDQCGAIIGKGGEVIKQLRDESGARISIGKKVDFVRTVSVSGNTENVQAAFTILIRLIHDHPSSARDPFLHGYRSQPSSSSSSSNYRGHSQYSYAPSHNISHHHHSPVSPGFPSSSSPHLPNPSAPFLSDGPTQTLSLSIPSRVVGAIIGKRGQTINEIRHLSGCRIDIAPQAEGSQFRTVTLIGSSQSVDIAHILIQKYTFQPVYQQ